MEINQSNVYHSKLKNAGHTYGAVYYGKIEFTIVNFFSVTSTNGVTASAGVTRN